MSSLKIFLNPTERNEATSYYVDLLRKGFECQFSDISEVSQVSDLKKDDIVLVITLYAFNLIRKYNKKQSIIYWFQGISPEELKMFNSNNSIRQILRRKYWSYIERKVLKKAKMLFFVSHAMQEHLKKKYGYNKENFLVIPCFNVELNNQAFDIQDKYKKPSFVYAGGILPWQCIEQTIRLFIELKKQIPEASLTILTKDIETAKSLAQKNGLNDLTVKHIPYQKLSEELQKYKYGMLLREDVIVNQVATPTKFNSYLALGIIPVFSNVIADFKQHINELHTKVEVDSLTEFSKTIRQIQDLESIEINPKDVEKEYRAVFEEYYNPTRYVSMICKKASEIFPK